MLQAKEKIVSLCREIWSPEGLDRAIPGFLITALILGHIVIPAVSVDITCSRSSDNIVDCELVRKSIVRSKKNFTLKDVRTVDIYEVGSAEKEACYLTEFINSDERNRTFLLYFFRHKAAYEAVRTINAFLRNSSKKTLTYSASNAWDNFSIRQLFT